MARIRCTQCGKKFSSKAGNCPYCAAISPAVDLSTRSDTASEEDAESRLVICEDCGKQISSRAPTCPHCGAPQVDDVPFRRFERRDWGFEWKSQATLFSYPLVHIAVGRKDGKLRVAKGIIAIGQFAIGLFTVAQFGIGLIFGLGQFMFGLVVIAQFAVALYFGLGQFATGYIAIGQFAFGVYALGQIAYGAHVWSKEIKDPEAFEFFRQLVGWIRAK